MNIIFLDIDGVFNCELFYRERQFKRKFTLKYWINEIRWRLKRAMNGFKSNTYSLAGFKHNPKHDLFNYRFKRFKAETCQKKWSWFNQLCKGTNARIVISSVWRRDFTIDEWNQVFKKMKFEYIKIIGITETNHTLRGTEIKDWLDKYLK